MWYIPALPYDRFIVVGTCGSKHVDSGMPNKVGIPTILVITEGCAVDKTDVRACAFISWFSGLVISQWLLV